MLPALDTYQITDADRLLTPALLIYPEVVRANIAATLKMTGNDPNRWRPHIKTTKNSATTQLLIGNGVTQFKCSTTLELLMLCEAGANDVLLAYPVMGANADRTKEIGSRYPQTTVSVLVEDARQASIWRGSAVGVFIDVNPGMNRTGIDPDRVGEIIALARDLGSQFRGIHFYDGHILGTPEADWQARAHQGYARLLELVHSLQAQDIRVPEIITSGTPAAPFAIAYPGFRDAAFVHRISPGTVVLNDITSMAQLPGWNYQPATVVLATVVSHPKPGIVTCDAGHKSVSADAGVPTCAVLGHDDWTPIRPSEEHLPIEVPDNNVPKLGDKLYLVPRHVCPTVNNFDEAIFVVEGRIQKVVPVSARGHESPLRMMSIATSV